MHLKVESNKKVYRDLKLSKVIGIGSDRMFCGFAYVIVPNDVDRDEYIRNVYRTGICMIVTDFNEIIKDVRVPQDLIQDLKFPITSGQYGSMISWNNIPKTNQVNITGIYLKPGEFYPYKEGIYTKHYSSKTNDSQTALSITNDMTRATRIVSLKNNSGSEGGLVFGSQSSVGSVKFTLMCNGKATLNADDSVNVVVENELRIQVGTKEDEMSSISMTKEGVLTYEDRYGNYIKMKDGEFQAESKIIKWGDGAKEAIVLGDTWKSLQKELIDAIQQITVTTPVGPSGPPINIASFIAIGQKLDTALSSKVKSE
jgi:hypothetical protein